MLRDVLNLGRASAIAGALGCLVIALAVYSLSGQPAINADPVLERARKEAPHDLAASVAQLAARLEAEPEDLDGWRLLSRSYALLGETEKAAEAARHVAELGARRPADATAHSAQAENLVVAAGGTVTAEARRLFQASLAADPGDPRARFFLALALAQDGQPHDALAHWLALEADSPMDAPWREGLAANIERLANDAGVGVPELVQRRAAIAQARLGALPWPDAAGLGPGSPDIAAAAKSAQSLGSLGLAAQAYVRANAPLDPPK
jgi:cytochrome c-type biogenesis protein CcmH